MRAEIAITHAEEDDLPQVMALLENSGLPTEGLAADWQNLVLAQSGKEIAGCEAIEIYGREGLLRSVAGGENPCGIACVPVNRNGGRLLSPFRSVSPDGVGINQM